MKKLIIGGACLFFLIFTSFSLVQSKGWPKIQHLWELSQRVSFRFPANMVLDYGCHDLFLSFLRPKDWGDFTKKDLKTFLTKIESASDFESDQQLQVMARLKAVQFDIKVDRLLLERLRNLPEFKKSEKIKQRITFLEVKLTSLGEESDVEFLLGEVAELEKNLLKGKLKKGSLNTKKLTKEQWTFLLSYGDLTPTKFQKSLSFVGSNALSLSPLFVLPMASLLLDGGLSAAFMAALKLSAGIKGMDKALDFFMNNASKIISKEKLVYLTAATTNIPELGASQVSALVGDPLAEVASTPLGSNPANFILGGVALLSSFKTVAVTKGIIRPGQRLGPKVVWKTFKVIDFQVMKRHMGMAGLFMLDALAFQYVVRPALNNGQILPLVGWLTFNIPLLARYFKKSLWDGKKELLAKASDFAPRGPVVLERLMKENQAQFKETSQGLMNVVENLKKTSKRKGRSLKSREVKKAFEDFKSELEESPSFQLEIERAMHTLDDEDFHFLMKLGGISPDSLKKRSASEKVKVFGSMIAGAAAICAFSMLLDDGVVDMTEAIPGMGKSEAGFFIVSFFSSLGEFLTTKKFFETGQFAAGAENIAFSNSINLALAKMALATSYFKHHFLSEESLPGE